MFLLDGRPVLYIPLFIPRDKRSAWHDNYLHSQRAHLLGVRWWAGTWEALANWILTTTWCDRACAHPGFLNERERKVFKNTFEIIISPIEGNFIKRFAVLDLWYLGRKFHKDLGNPQIGTCIFPQSISTGVCREDGAHGRRGLGVGLAQPVNAPHAQVHIPARTPGREGIRNVTSRGPCWGLVDSWDYGY